METERLTEAVSFFRKLEFFCGQAQMSDAALGQWVADRYLDEHGTPFDTSDELADLRLLHIDRDRVWWEDTEADVCEPKKVYKQVLQEWARISRGAFSPTEIVERWDSDEGPITVGFRHQGQAFTLNPEFADDWMDLAILIPLNRLVAPSGIQFELYEAFDQTAFIVALKAPEKQQVISARGWRFASVSS